jgi:hypothetical protein
MENLLNQFINLNTVLLALVYEVLFELLMSSRVAWLHTGASAKPCVS